MSTKTNSTILDKRNFVLFEMAQEIYYSMKGQAAIGNKTLKDWVETMEVYHKETSTVDVMRIYANC